MKEERKVQAPAPLFRDPIYDCPTDPVVIWNKEEKLWYLFYTQRRAADVNIGVSYVHGTKIGVATSTDGGKWLYRGALEGLDIEKGHNTFWAPEIIYGKGEYHMYVSYITGIPTDWDYPRKLLHYTSPDLWSWIYAGEIPLQSDRVIDACIYETAPSLYKMWYKDEEHGSRTYAAISTDLYQWKVVGEEVSDCPQEGPNVFEFQGIKWMISDYWHGLAVYRSEDFIHWERCKDILTESGSRSMDVGLGHHADILVCGNRAYIFYFCHPYASENQTAEENISENDRNKAVIQVAELIMEENHLICNRNQSVDLFLNSID